MLKIFYHEALGGWQTPEITPFENLVLHPAAKVFHYAVEVREIILKKTIHFFFSILQLGADVTSIIYSFQLFEGMKAYRGVDGKIRLFRPELNMERMNASAARCGLPQFSGSELIRCLDRLISIDQEWVPHSEASSLYIRPTLIGIDVSLSVSILSFQKFINFCEILSIMKSVV